MQLYRLAALFEHEPFAATVLFAIIAITGVAVIVAGFIGAFCLFDSMKARRDEHAREAALARRAQAA
jgi:hypothetical protein